jgi:hypothetical protein
MSRRVKTRRPSGPRLLRVDSVCSKGNSGVAGLLDVDQQPHPAAPRDGSDEKAADDPDHRTPKPGLLRHLMRGTEVHPKSFADS